MMGLMDVLNRLNKVLVIFIDDDEEEESAEEETIDEPPSSVLGVYHSLQWVSRGFDPHPRLRSGGLLRMPVDQLVLLFASISGMAPCAKVLALIQSNTDKNDPKAASSAVELMLVCVVERAYSSFLSKDHGSKRLDVIPPILYNDLLSLLQHHRTSDDPRSHAVTESVRATFRRMLSLVEDEGREVVCLDMDGNVFSDPDGGKLDSLMRACRNLINSRGLLASEFPCE